MFLFALGRKLEFLPVRLMIHGNGITNLFAKKNNKTVAETLASRRYSRLSPEMRRRYPNSLNDEIGEFLYSLKMNGDAFYLEFLNGYGDRTYCDFSMSEHKNSKGLYSFAVHEEIKYIGRSHDPFDTRINQGYGHLSPKNCYRDGQVTNCHLNSLIAEHWEQISFYVCPLEYDLEIDALELTLIQQLHPEWNTALRA